METYCSFKYHFEKISKGNSPVLVFDDFLRLLICNFSRDFETGKSRYYDEYVRIATPYRDNDTLKDFQQMLKETFQYADEMRHSETGNDLLGEFYEKEIVHDDLKGKLFKPFPVAIKMVNLLRNQKVDSEKLMIVDPKCETGRVFLAYTRLSVQKHFFFGIAENPLYARITAVNLFINQLCGEIICFGRENDGSEMLALHISPYWGILKVRPAERKLFRWIVC